MKTLIAIVMFANAALFVFGAIQHAGVALGPFHEPRIVPATIVEGLCAAALAWGAAALLAGSASARVAAFTGNLVAIGGVVLGMVALAAGAGPRTASNDLYHRIMLALAAAALVMLFTPAARTSSLRK